MFDLVQEEVELKAMLEEKIRLLCPCQTALEESFKTLSLKEEAYFKDTTFVGNTTHKIFNDFREGKNTLLDCFKGHPELHKNYLNIFLILTRIDTLTSQAGEKSAEQREVAAKACEMFCKVFSVTFKRNLTRN